MKYMKLYLLKLFPVISNIKPVEVVGPLDSLGALLRDYIH